MTLLKFTLGAALEDSDPALELPGSFRLSSDGLPSAESFEDPLDPALPSGPIGLKVG